MRTYFPAIGFLAVLILSSCGKQKQDSIFETYIVQRETISTTVTATGTVQPADTVTVGTQVSGIIDKIYVDYNSLVKKGQIIAELDKSTLEADLMSGKATADANAAELKYQEANYKRTKDLFAKNVVSQTEMELAEYNYSTAKANYDKSQAELLKLERNLGYATITSPIDGIVLSRSVEEGQTVASSYSTPTLFTIAENLSSMVVIADVDEADIGGVKTGQEVNFTVDAFPDDFFRGVVSEIRLSPRTSSSVVTYEVVITVDNCDLKLLPGLTATVTIITNHAGNALCVPREAFEFRPVGIVTEAVGGTQDVPVRNNDKGLVFVMKDGKLQPRIVHTGIKTTTKREILDGLAEGDSVVTAQRSPQENIDLPPEGNTNPFMPQPPGRKKK